MAVSAKWYGKGLLAVANNDVDFAADTIKLLLTTSSYTPDQDAHDFRDDVTNEVANGNGYTTRGVTLGSKTAAYDTGSNEVRLDAADVSWTSASFTARYAVIYKARGGASSADELLGYIDFGGDETVSSGTFSIVFDSTGVLKITAA